MAERAYQCFHRRYDMRENAKAIIRLFETATVVPVLSCRSRVQARWRKQVHYNAAEHIPAETAADPYLRPAFR